MDMLITISNSRLRNKYGVQTAWVLALVLLVLAISRVAWTAYSQAEIKKTNYEAQTVTPIKRATQPSYRVRDIVSANLFGDPNPKIVKKEAPKTTLNLTLQGILWASEPDFARAIITSGRTRSELYSVGENIKGAGASVKEIRTGDVLLNRNGATESLPMDKKTSGVGQPLLSFTDATNFQSASIKNNAANIRKRASRRLNAESTNTNLSDDNQERPRHDPMSE